MGLDLVLGGLVLVVAIRGWLKGFLTQAIRLGGLVAAAYAAAPLRDQARPYALAQLPTMRPELLDRLLWWGLAFASYFVIVGVASLTVAVSRRRSFGLDEPNRGDQFAGFGFGVAKGLILAAFAVAGLQKYAEPQIEKVDWAARQKSESYAWQWNERYHPAARLWATPPVQNFVGHVRRMGFLGAPKARPKPEAPAEPPVQTASRTPKLRIEARPTPGRRPFDPGVDTSGLDPEMAGQVESILQRLRALAAPTGADD